MPTSDMRAETLELAKALVARSSVSTDGGGCLEIIAERLTAAGFNCERMDREGVANLYARRGTDAPVVCFAGHVDVVPPGPLDAWQSDPFAPTERDGFLIGRGTADMKVSVAAMTTAFERVVTAHPAARGSLALLLTGDEEGAGLHGTKAVVEMLQARGERFTACIVGEPTSAVVLGDTMKNGRRGSLNGVLHVRGVQCHIAYPELGVNPIHRLAPALAELVAMRWDDGNDHFPPTSFQVSNVHSGTGANNVIPGTLELLFNFRFSTASTEQDLKARVHAVLDRHGLDYAIDWSLSGAPFVTGQGPLVQAVREAVREVTGRTPALSTGGGTSDGRFLAAIADEVVEFGPLNDTIHQVNERVSLADIAPLSTIYERAVTRLLGA